MARKKKRFDDVPFREKRQKPPSRRTTQEEREKGRARQPAAVAKLRRSDGGKAGAKVTSVKIRISGQRSETMAMRSRPGTFEWRYGRKKQDVLFHAGSHLAVLWERAGIALASSADFLRGTGYMVRAIALLALLAVAGCTTAGGSFCAVEHPIRPTKAEVATLSDASVAEILAHNRKGQKLCGWKP
ncbi:hypothetical protein ACVDG5_008555 [Mesorhizobium sp. ORM6]